MNTCQMCDHQWQPKKKNSSQQCPRCQSYVWDATKNEGREISRCLCGCGRIIVGDPYKGRVGHRIPEPTRFWHYVKITETCWLWQGAKSVGGYGRFCAKEILCMSHRWAYENLVGPIPKGLQLDHLCRVRNCVNPEHLEPVTPRENTMRGDTPARRNVQKTHCHKGHPFSKENTYVHPSGSRICRECMRHLGRLYDRLHRQKNKRIVHSFSSRE